MKLPLHTALVFAVISGPLSGFALADPLNPLTYPSLGNVTLAPGAYTIDTEVTPPTITGPGGVPVFAGSLFGEGTSAIAVFAFDGLVIPADAVVTITGRRPLAVLSRGDMTIAANLNISGGDGVPTYYGCAGRAGQPRAGWGAGGVGSAPISVSALNSGGACRAGHGSGPGGARGRVFGAGTPGTTPPRPGVAYGNLLLALEGGSGGSGGLNANHTGTSSTDFLGSGGGGAGGGGLELGALGTLTISGNIFADGGTGLNNDTLPAAPGGGGSGGGVLLHATSINLAAPVSARGGACRPRLSATGGNVSVPGNGGSFGGVGGESITSTPPSGGGGGGRVAIQSVNTPSLAGVDVSGGPQYNGAGNPGEPGVITSARVALITQTLDFGVVAVGSSKTLFMGISNGGDPDTSINGQFPAPAVGSPFARVGDGVFSSLKPGQFQGNPYTFAPATEGTFTQTLAVLSNAGPVQVMLIGRSGAPACDPDFNHDGNVDPDDLSDYIAAYFAGCP